MNILSGTRVIDLTQWAFVPSAGGVLAHWGADVIKVEPPRIPDPMRTLTGGSPKKAAEANALFKHYSRGKRAIALDLNADEGRDILYSLVKTADVFLTSFLPRTRKKLKFELADVRAVNPKIIYARGTGQGPKGPDAERGGYDGVTWWGRGSLAQTTMDVSGATWPTGMVGHGDGMSGMTLAGGICAALYHRAMTGEPLVVDASLMGTAVWFNGPAIIAAGQGQQWGGIAFDARTQRHPSTNTYKTRDGRFFNLSMLGDFQDEWVDLVEHLGRPDLATDPRFATSEARNQHVAEGVAIFDEIFAQRTLAEWKERLQTTRGVWAVTQTPAEIHEDVQTKANGFVRTVDYGAGSIALPVPPILFNEDAGEVPPAPDFGQHTDAVLDELGISKDAIARLRERGVVA